MKTLNWYYPETLADAEKLIRQKSIHVHGGGTGLLLRKLSAIDGLIELSRLHLNSIAISDKTLEIGSSCSYADVVAELQKADPDHILCKCLHHSANTPLRNRITIGGSIAMFPPWSDLMGALIALDARVSLLGKNAGDFSIKEYIEAKELREDSLITTLKCGRDPWISGHYREIRTKSDMPSFNHTVLLNVANGKIVDSRIIVVGTVSKYTRLNAVEDYLADRKVDTVDAAEIEARTNVAFSGNRFDDPEYTGIKAGIELGRLILQLVRS